MWAIFSFLLYLHIGEWTHMFSSISTDSNIFPYVLSCVYIREYIPIFSLLRIPLLPLRGRLVLCLTLLELSLTPYFRKKYLGLLQAGSAFLGFRSPKSSAFALLSPFALWGGAWANSVVLLLFMNLLEKEGSGIRRGSRSNTLFTPLSIPVYSENVWRDWMGRLGATPKSSSLEIVRSTD